MNGANGKRKKTTKDRKETKEHGAKRTRWLGEMKLSFSLLLRAKKKIIKTETECEMKTNKKKISREAFLWFGDIVFAAAHDRLALIVSFAPFPSCCPFCYLLRNFVWTTTLITLPCLAWWRCSFRDGPGAQVRRDETDRRKKPYVELCFVRSKGTIPKMKERKKKT